MHTLKLSLSSKYNYTLLANPSTKICLSVYSQNYFDTIIFVLTIV